MKENRRDFLRILGIGGTAGLTGCSRTAPDALATYAVPPEEAVKGRPQWFRSTCRECPAGCGIEVRVREGRVHKVEGNPLHPVNGGGLCARGQAAVQGLYNPDRLRAPLIGGRAVSWGEALQAARAGLTASGPITVITGAVTGAISEIARGLGRHILYEPIAYERLREANRLAFGVAGLPVLRFADARAIYVFGADVLETFVSPVGYARGIGEARHAGGRMVYIGSRLSLTGARADQWVGVRPGAEGLLAMAVVKEALPHATLAGEARARIAGWAAPFTAERAGVPAGTVAALARDACARPSLAVAGGTASDDVFTCVAVNLLNVVTGAVNRTLRFDRAAALDGVTARPDLGDSAVIVAGANPAYSLRGFKPRFLVALASWADETTQMAQVVLPVHTPLESWGEYEPWAGIHSLLQPAMQPVFNTREAGDVLLELGGQKPDFHARLRLESLQRGGWWEEVAERSVKLELKALPEPLPDGRGSVMLQTYPSLAHFDGRGANRPWLQELPDPVTQAVWDSWIEIHPRDASARGIATGDRVSVRSEHGQVEAAACVYPGVQPGAVAMPLGQGHTFYGRYATGVGVNAAALLDGRFSGVPVEIALARKARGLVIIAGHDYEENRGIANARRSHQPNLSMYPPHEHPLHRWAMAIDLDACTACSACVVACYAENNVPVAGREEAARGRHMSWLRVERFFKSQPFAIDFTLMLCQQCDKAPCEAVCPAYASYHTAEGLNGQVYNRCVGTRYCSNNCPYKTRRFNWYPAEFPSPLNWQLNPDVTVRSKGVMEKCTFCVQRIVAGKDRARLEGRPVRDADVAPACAQSCPTGAIVFGDLNNPESQVAKLVRGPRAFRVLEELNTRPAVTYLERERRA